LKRGVQTEDDDEYEGFGGSDDDRGWGNCAAISRAVVSLFLTHVLGDMKTAQDWLLDRFESDSNNCSNEDDKGGKGGKDGKAREGAEGVGDKKEEAKEGWCVGGDGRRAASSVWVWNLVLLLFIVLRGVSQVYLCSNPVSGLLIVVACYLSAPGLAGYCVLGALLSALAARITVAPPRQESLWGITGYNGVLTGGAIYTFFGDDDAGDSHSRFLVACWLVSLTGVLSSSAARLLGQFGLPAFTAAFNFVVISILLAVDSGAAHVLTFRQSPVHTERLDYDAMFFVEGTLKGVSQFIFVDDITGACLVMAAIAVYNRYAALAAVLGSLLGLLSTMFLLDAADGALEANVQHDMKNGLYGYCSAGTMVVFAGAFMYDPSKFASWVLGGVGCSLAALMQVMMMSMGVPVCTLPFCVASWMLLLADSNQLTTTEDGRAEESAAAVSLAFSAALAAARDEGMEESVHSVYDALTMAQDPQLLQLNAAAHLTQVPCAPPRSIRSHLL
jgi:urea transporter